MLEKLEYILVMKVMIILNWRDKRGAFLERYLECYLCPGCF